VNERHKRRKRPKGSIHENLIVEEQFLEWEALGLIEDTGKVRVGRDGREQIVWKKIADREDITRADPPWFDEEDEPAA
jgi:hypothetical protein